MIFKAPVWDAKYVLNNIRETRIETGPNTHTYIYILYNLDLKRM